MKTVTIDVFGHKITIMPEGFIVKISKAEWDDYILLETKTQCRQTQTEPIDTVKEYKKTPDEFIFEFYKQLEDVPAADKDHPILLNIFGKKISVIPNVIFVSIIKISEQELEINKIDQSGHSISVPVYPQSAYGKTVSEFIDEFHKAVYKETSVYNKPVNPGIYHR